MAAKVKKYQGLAIGVLAGAVLMYASLFGYDYYRFTKAVAIFKAQNCVTTQ